MQYTDEFLALTQIGITLTGFMGIVITLRTGSLSALGAATREDTERAFGKCLENRGDSDSDRSAADIKDRQAISTSSAILFTPDF